MIFVQRDPTTGTGQIEFEGDSARVLKDGQVVVGWTHGGRIADVPQGDGYTLEIRSGGVVTSEPFAIGVVVMAAGQSNMSRWFLGASGVDAATGTYQLRSDGQWGEVIGSAARSFTALLAEQLGVPVAIVDTSLGGSSLPPEGDYGFGYWLSRDDPQSGFNQAVAEMALAGGRAEIVLWSQGESNARVTSERYAEALNQLFDWFAEAFGARSMNIQEIGPHDALFNGSLSAQLYASVRAGQHAVADARDDTVIGAYTLDSELFDPNHLDGPSRAAAAAHMVFAELARLGLDGAMDHRRDGSDSSTIEGTAGIDDIDGGAGADVILGHSGHDVLYGGLGDDVVAGGAGNDIMRGGAGKDRLSGGAGHDIIGGGAGADRIWGGDGNDEIWGGFGNDGIAGEAGDDLIYANAGNDTVDGGDGNDTVYGGDGNDELIGGRGNDRLYGDEGNNRLYGGDGGDRLTGGTGNDLLDGGAGADTLVGGGGRDTLLGGAGNDYIELLGTPALVDGGIGAADRLRIFGNAVFESGSIRNIERIEVGDGARADFSAFTTGLTITSLSVTGGSARILGSRGNDTLIGGDGADALWGSGGNDILSGGAGQDTLYGGAGDTLLGGAGNDHMEIDGTPALVDGGAGSGDRLRITGEVQFAAGSIVGIERIELAAGARADFSALQAGVSVNSMLRSSSIIQFTGTAYDDVFLSGGGAAVEWVRAGDGDDAVRGGAGNDLLWGEAGHDSLYGEGGNDTLEGGAGDDRLVGGDGNDTLNGGVGDDRLHGQAGNDMLAGHAGIDRLDGGAGHDRLDGGSGDDTLSGGEGDDRLMGGAGRDTLSGGAGADHFVFGRGSGADTVIDFGAGWDVLDLAGFGYGEGFAEVRTVKGADLFLSFGSDQIRLRGFLNEHESTDLVSIRDADGMLLRFELHHSSNILDLLAG